MQMELNDGIMNTGRRDFLRGMSGLGAVAALAGCAGTKLGLGGGGSMSGFTVPPMKEINVGMVGVGGRGRAAVHRLSLLPGVRITALCDLDRSRAEEQAKWLRDNGYTQPVKIFDGPEGYKALCDDPCVNVAYSCLPRDLHGVFNVYAMEAGQHVMQEVPGAFTLDECWQTVETAEKTRRHCMMLENDCYEEISLLSFNLIKKGLLGEIVHADCAYIHDQRELQFGKTSPWRIKRHMTRHGNYYPTHALGPIAKSMDINHGDRFDYLVSLESKSAGFEYYAEQTFPVGAPQRDWRMVKGDMNTTLIRTALGHSIMLQHNVSLPRPYSSIHLLSGTRGIVRQYPEYAVCFETKTGDKSTKHYFDKEKAEQVRKEYMHPLWKTLGKLAKKAGGHGGCDFVMDLRWVYCLQNGLPLDTDVYDLASWSSIVELSEASVNGRSKAVDFPDFTRGAWKTAKPFEIVDVDIDRMGLGEDQVKKDKTAYEV